MKGLKLSKTSWLILAAGVFVVILAGLGLTRSQQLSEQTNLDDAMAITTARLNSLEVTQLEREKAALQQQLDESMIELDEVKYRMRQTVVSVDVADEFFRIAEYSDIEVLVLKTTSQTAKNLGSVDCLTTIINANIKGDLSDMIDFVINLNNGLTTGMVQSISINIPEDPIAKKPTASIVLSIYSYEGS